MLRRTVIVCWSVPFMKSVGFISLAELLKVSVVLKGPVIAVSPRPAPTAVALTAATDSLEYSEPSTGANESQGAALPPTTVQWMIRSGSAAMSPSFRRSSIDWETLRAS
jgi:hypothetical protein